MSFVSKFILYDYDLYLKYDMETLAKVLVKIAGKVCGLSSKGESSSMSCHEEIVKLYRKFKTNFKGMNNLFKFTDEKVVELVDAYFAEEGRKWLLGSGLSEKGAYKVDIYFWVYSSIFLFEWSLYKNIDKLEKWGTSISGKTKMKQQSSQSSLDQ